jgi:hypothetical protein
MGPDGPAWTATLRGYEALGILEGGRVLSTPGMAALRADQPPRSMDAPPPMVSWSARSGE